MVYLSESPGVSLINRRAEAHPSALGIHRKRWTGWWQTPVLGMAYTNLDLALGNNGESALTGADYFRTIAEGTVD